VLVGLHRSAATRAAIADGIEAAQHGILEIGVTDMAPVALGAEDLYGLVLGDPMRAAGVVVGHKAGKGLAND
jgi:hypothetical protein